MSQTAVLSRWLRLIWGALMHDSFESLLSRCRRYHRQRMLKRFGVGLLSLGGIAAIAVAVLGPGMQSSEPKMAIAAQPLKAAVQEPTVKTVAETNAAENGRNNTLPSANPVSGDSAEAVPALPEKRRDVAYRVAVDEGYLLDYTASKQTMQQQAKPIQPVKVREQNSEQKTATQIPVSEPSAQQTLKMSTKKLLSIDDLIAQQEKEPRYELALKIASHYYDDAKYTQASLWSKKANMLDKEADGAWIVYAKAEYARGNKDRAIDILSLYLANKNSKEAEMLLMTWRQGE